MFKELEKVDQELNEILIEFKSAKHVMKAPLLDKLEDSIKEMKELVLSANTDQTAGNE